jgi:hypothetical protein
MGRGIKGGQMSPKIEIDAALASLYIKLGNDAMNAINASTEFKTGTLAESVDTLNKSVSREPAAGDDLDGTLKVMNRLAVATVGLLKDLTMDAQLWIRVVERLNAVAYVGKVLFDGGTIETLKRAQERPASDVVDEQLEGLFDDLDTDTQN